MPGSASPNRRRSMYWSQNRSRSSHAIVTLFWRSASPSAWVRPLASKPWSVACWRCHKFKGRVWTLNKLEPFQMLTSFCLMKLCGFQPTTHKGSIWEDLTLLCNMKGKKSLKVQWGRKPDMMLWPKPLPLLPDTPCGPAKTKSHHITSNVYHSSLLVPGTSLLLVVEA